MKVEISGAEDYRCGESSFPSSVHSTSADSVFPKKLSVSTSTPSENAEALFPSSSSEMRKLPEPTRFRPVLDFYIPKIVGNYGEHSRSTTSSHVSHWRWKCWR